MELHQAIACVLDRAAALKTIPVEKKIARSINEIAAEAAIFA